MKKDYSKYSLEELVEDENFISWVLDSNKDFEQWYNSSCDDQNRINEARSIVNALHATDYTASKATTSALWDKIDDEINRREEPKKIYPLWKKLAIAASFILILSTGILFVPSDISTELAENDVYKHSDGTIITLNESTELDYPRIKSLSKRNFKLRGEAFFDVTKGDKFLVKTEFGEIEVLGTSFNIYSRQDSLVVSCFSGKVAVRIADAEVILFPGEEVRAAENDSSLKKTINREAKPSWMLQIFSASQIELGKVFKDLEEKFDVKITSDSAIKSERYSGKFTIKSVDQALEVICATKGLNYTKKGDHFYITR